MKFRIILLAVLAGTAFLSACTPKGEQTDQSGSRPNIIVLFSDELQFEDLGFCGGNIPTPNIDALAAEGLYFENAYTPAPMCTPSRYALLSGRFPGRCTDPAFLEDYPITEPYCIGWNTYLDSSVKTLPRLLSANGYITGMVGKWHVSSGKQIRAGLKGDDSPKDASVNEKLVLHQQLVAAKVMEDAGFDVAKSVMFGNYDGFAVKALRVHNFPWFNKGALDFIEAGAKGDKPFFLYLAATSLHGPHHAEGLVRDYSFTPEGKIEGIDAYNLDVDKLAAEIESKSSPESHRYTGMAFLDHQVGSVMDKLKELDIEENTIVIFLPDHNTEPGKASCYEKGIKISMIIKWPGKIDAASRTSAQVQSIDIMPTILDIVGAGLPEGYKIDGQSMLPVIENNELPLKKYIFSESGFTRSVSDGTYKYIAFRYPERLVKDMKDGKLDKAPTQLDKPAAFPLINMTYYPSYWDADQLFDLSKDPYEQDNLAVDPLYTEKLASLKAVLQEHLDTFDHAFDLSPCEFMDSEQYRILVEASSQGKLEDIFWFERDWGTITWPPVE